MKALLINAVCGIRSTGKICIDLATKLESQGYEVKVAYGRETVPTQYKKYGVKIGNNFDVYFHALMARLFDQRGYWSKYATKRFLKWAEEYDPDLLWLHNLHDYFINIEMLFDWIKSRPNMEVRWTQHDCWAFTGSCFHFTVSNCTQWCTQCKRCPSKKLVSNPPLIRTPKYNYLRKKEIFLGVQNMTLIAPSEWIAQKLHESFFGRYKIEVMKNDIDHLIFKPTTSDFRKRNNLEDKRIVLGVASAWNAHKGLMDFVELNGMLNRDEVVVLVGLNDKQKEDMPNDIITLGKTDSVFELAEIYSSADVFVNLTYEDTYPTVNLEAQACGTPCVTYRTGGSPESVPSENVIDVGDIQRVVKRIHEIFSNGE